MCTLHDLALNGVLAHKTVNEHRPSLANAMGTILGLEIHLRVLTKQDNGSAVECVNEGCIDGNI